MVFVGVDAAGEVDLVLGDKQPRLRWSHDARHSANLSKGRRAAADICGGSVNCSIAWSRQLPTYAYAARKRIRRANRNADHGTPNVGLKGQALAAQDVGHRAGRQRRNS